MKYTEEYLEKFVEYLFRKKWATLDYEGKKAVIMSHSMTGEELIKNLNWLEKNKI